MNLFIILYLSQKHSKIQSAWITITHAVCFSLHNQEDLSKSTICMRKIDNNFSLHLQEVAAITGFNIFMMQCDRLLRLTMLALLLNLAVLVIGRPLTYSKSSDSSSPTSRCSRIIRRLIAKFGKEIVNDLVDRYLQNSEDSDVSIMNYMVGHYPC